MVESVSALPLPQAHSGNAVALVLEPGTELKARVEANLPGGVVRLTSQETTVDLRVSSPLPVGADVTVSVSGSRQQPVIQITVSGAPREGTSSPHQAEAQTPPARDTVTLQQTATQAVPPRSAAALAHLVQSFAGASQQGGQGSGPPVVIPQDVPSQGANPPAAGQSGSPLPSQAVQVSGGPVAPGSVPGNLSGGTLPVPEAPGQGLAGSAARTLPGPQAGAPAPAALAQTGSAPTPQVSAPPSGGPEAFPAVSGRPAVEVPSQATGQSPGPTAGLAANAPASAGTAAQVPTGASATPPAGSSLSRTASTPVSGAAQTTGGSSPPSPQLQAGAPSVAAALPATPATVQGPELLGQALPGQVIQPDQQAQPQAPAQVTSRGIPAQSASSQEPRQTAAPTGITGTPAQGAGQGGNQPVASSPGAEGRQEGPAASAAAAGARSVAAAQAPVPASTGPVATARPTGEGTAGLQTGGSAAPAAKAVLPEAALVRATPAQPYGAARSAGPELPASQGIEQPPPGALRQVANALQAPLAEQQAGLGSLFAQIGAMAGAQAGGKISLPDPVVKAMQQILGLRVNTADSLNGKDLQAAVRLSGQFREAQLVQQGGGQQPLPDLKSALLSLKSILQQFGAEARISRPAVQPSAPSRHGAPRAQAQHRASGFWSGGTAQNLKSLLQDTDSALARIRMTQLVNSGLVKDDGPHHASRPMDTVLELPLALGQETAVMQMQVGRDGGGNEGEEEREPAWRLRFALDLTATGPLEAAISLRGGGTYASLWIDRKETFDHLNGLRQTMEAAFADAGLDLQEFRLIRGLPPRTAARYGALVDRQS